MFLSSPWLSSQSTVHSSWMIYNCICGHFSFQTKWTTRWSDWYSATDMISLLYYPSEMSQSSDILGSDSISCKNIIKVGLHLFFLCQMIWGKSTLGYQGRLQERKQCYLNKVHGLWAASSSNLFVPSGWALAIWHIYHFYFNLQYFSSFQMLHFAWLDNTQFLISSAGHMVTWWHLVKNLASGRLSSRPIAISQK